KVVVDGANGLIEKFTINEEYEYLFKKTIQILLHVDDKAGNEPQPIENKTSGIGKYQYRLEKEKKWGEWKDLEQSKVNKNLFTILYEKDNTDFSGKIEVRVIDNSGNVSSECVKDSDNKDAIAVVDNTTPEMPTVNATTKVDGAEYKDEKYNGEWTNKEITVILGMEKIPTSQIKKFQYTISEEEKVKENEWIDFTETDGSFKDVTGKSINNKLIIKENQNETYKFRVVNRTGTGSDENYVWTEHDKNKLEVKLQKAINQKANEGMCNIESPVGEDDWYVEDAKITLTNIKADAEEAKIRTYYKVNDAITGNVVYEEKNFGEKFDENPVEQPEGKHEPITLYDGEYTLTYYLKDEAGNNSTSVTKTIKVDKASPKIDSMKIGEKSILDDDDKEAIKPYKSAQTIKLAASDETSKLDKIYYQISDNKRGELELKNIANWIPYNEENGITVYPNKKFIIYVKACDKAGNFSHESYSKEILIDNVNPSSEKSAPNISIEPANKSQTGYYNDDVKINISAIDPKYYGTKIDNINGVCSGLKTISYKVLNQNRQTQEGTLLEDGKKDSFNSSIVIDKNLNNSNNVVVEVIAIDNAGNTKTSKTSVSEIMIDITKPTIDVSYDNNNIVVESGKNYFKQDRQATVTITERNFNSKKVNFQITGTNGAKPTISEFRTIRAGGNGDNTKHIATITYSADGDYTFNVSYVDEAINANSGVNYARNSAAPTSFVIDKTAPKLDVSYSNNNVKNGKFFKANRIATITVVEHNFLPKNVLITKTATKNNAVIAQPALSNWVTNGDTHTATLNFNVDGDYTFDVKMSDNAKNDGVIGFGNSAAAKAFTIDTTFVNPNIDGVENGHAYKKDVVPKISFSDLNFDNYKLSLLRTTKDKINVNVTRQFVKTVKINANGGTTVIDSLKPLQENDGIYTLSVYMSDKAGNEHTTTKMFSVNRFGSVYVFGKDTIDIQNEYAQEIVKDIVVSEFNPNKLVDGSTSVEITCDGVPLAKPIFKVTQAKDTTGTTDGGWFQYNYVISADNFKKDGIYRVKVSSHDLAGNKPENTNYDDGAIIFRIDNVKPQLSSILGLEKPFIKAGSAHVKFDVFDAISLKKITVFVDGKAVKTFDKFEDAINFQGGFDIDEGVGHKIRIVMEDMAGNISDTDVENAGVNFEKTVTVSTNAFLLWYSNKALFWSTIAGAVLLIGIAIFIIVKISRRKSE
ncbi:MAG: Ig-like domain repeat protein, partial [Oscillospiraceae bacterium]